MSFSVVLEQLLAGQSLSLDEADQAMEAIIGGAWEPARVGAFLIALRHKGEAASEIAGFAGAMRRAAIAVEAPPDALDMCGTGGDGSGTFNVSTAAALVAAAAGLKVVKHGNRAVSSKAGSADVLEALGIPTGLGPEDAARTIAELGFGFLFAPRYHPAMARVAPIRRALGVRTVFNCLGPLVNPAAPRFQLMGVFSPELLPLVANALAQQEIRRAFVVHGAGGLDEVSTLGRTRLVEVKPSGGIDERWLTLDDLGLPRASAGALQGGDANTNARLIEAILAGEDRGPARDIVLANAGCALWLMDRVAGPAEGVAEAGRIIDAGQAAQLLEQLRR